MTAELQKIILGFRQVILRLGVFGRKFFAKQTIDIVKQLKRVLADKEARQQELRIIEDKIVLAENGIHPLIDAESELSKKISILETQMAENQSEERRRALKNARWNLEKERHEITEKRWKLSESLSELRIDIKTTFADILALENQEVMLESVLERKTHQTKKSLTAVPSISREELAKRHVLVADSLRLSLRMFKVKPGMTILTILGIGVSFATIFVLVSLGYGLERILLGQISSESSLRVINVTSPNLEISPITDSLISRLRATEHVRAVHAIGRLAGHVEFGGLVAETEVRAVDTEYFLEKIITVAPSVPDTEGVVMTTGLLALLGKRVSTGVLGEQVGLTVRSLTGDHDIVVESIPIVGYVEDNERSDIYIPLSVVPKQELRYEEISVVVDSPQSIQPVRSVITDLGYLSSAIADTVEQASEIFRIVEIALALFGASALIVATIGMINTMTVSLLERTQEIGVMKILGVADRDVRLLFLTESTIMGLLGGASGITIGFIVAYAFNAVVNVLAGALGGPTVQLFYSPTWFIAAIFISATVIGLFTGAVPSRRAARMDPLDALKYK